MVLGAGVGEEAIAVGIGLDAQAAKPTARVAESRNANNLLIRYSPGSKDRAGA